MRINYLFLSMLMVAGLSACQQEGTSVTTVEQPEAIISAQQAEEVTAPATETVTEAAKEMVEEVPKELATIEKVNTNKAVMKEPVKALASPAVPEPAVIAPAVVEKPVAAARAVEEVKPDAVIERASGDPVQGARVARKCAACHTFEQGGKNKTGPNLFAVFGRTKGAATGFRYGSYLNAQNTAGEMWDEVSLRAWNADSKAVAKAGGGSSKMPAQKITGTKADDLIAYLKSLK